MEPRVMLFDEPISGADPEMVGVIEGDERLGGKRHDHDV